MRAISRASCRIVSALTVVALAAAWGAAARARGDVSLTISPRPLEVRPVERGFLGLALEYRSVPGLVGTDLHAVDPVLLQLIRNLAPDSRPMLRIGGQSTDRSWWPVRGIAQPRGITYSLSPDWLRRAQALAAAANARLILGVGLEANQPRIDGVEAAKLLGGIDRRYVDALEIGNEPELYTVIPWYRVLHGEPIPWYSQAGNPVFARSLGYGPAAFAADFVRVLRVIPHEPIAATGAPGFLAALNPYLTPTGPIRMTTWHAYGLNACVTDPFSPLYPSVPHLLAPLAANADVAGISPLVGHAHREHASFRVDEMGSISCNGRRGVSDTFASALWLMDALFVIAARGVDGVNLHTYPTSVNALFDVAHHARVWQGAVHPLYYGALMFARAAPTGARLLPISPQPPAPLRWWATLGRDHLLRLLLINDSLARGARLDVTLPPGFAAGTIQRLTAPSAYATGGVSLGGATFGAATTTGALPPPTPDPASAFGARLRIALPRSSAALITLAPTY